MLNELTDREKQVQELAAKGLTNKQIADKMGITFETVRSHKKSLRKKHALNEAPQEQTKEEKDLMKFYQMQVQHLQTQVKNHERTSALETAILEQFKERLTVYQPKKIDFIPQKKTKTERKKQDFVALLSDIHGGEIVNGEEIMGLNEYNLDIVKQRLDRWADSIVKIVQNDMENIPFDTAHIPILGDVLNGIIHQELLQGVAMCDQIIQTMEAVASAIEKIHTVFPNIEIPCVVGNHGRLHQKPYAKKKWDNFDYILYKMLELRLSTHKGIKFYIPKAAMMVYEIQGWNFLLTHGDGIKGGFAGFPYYGLNRFDGNITRTMVYEKNIYPHYLVMGHFHQSLTQQKVGGEIIINNSVKGLDEYAFGRFQATNEPKQTVFWVHPEQGKTWQADVWLVDKKK